MKNIKALKVASTILALSIMATGCSSTSSNKENKASKPKVEFAKSVNNGGEAKSDATLRYGLISGEPFTGLWNPVFSLTALDGTVARMMTGGTFAAEKNSDKIKQDSDTDAVKFHIDKDKKQAVFTINKDLKWNNGEEVTSDDIIATYMMMGNPNFTENVRYNDSMERIVGMADYHEGKAKEISGIKKVDDKTVTITFTKLHPGIQFGDGLVFDFLNHKQVEAVKDFTKFAEAELNRKPLSYGPYYIDKEVVGEGVILKQNPYFFKKDKVKLKTVEVKRITPAQASSVIKAGEVDMVDISPTIWNSIKDYKNGTILGEGSRELGYIGFKLGKRDKEKGEVVVDPNAKLADKNLRQAMGYALDRDQIHEKIFKGLTYSPTGSGMYPPILGKLANPNATKFDKDVEKAKKLLDEAGYKDKDGDGLREGKNGQKLVIKLAKVDAGRDYDQTLADFYIKSWKDIGLDVQLSDGKMMSGKDFNQRVQADDPEIDVFVGGWTFGTLANREEFMSRKSALNWYRYASDTLDADMKEQESEEMFDETKMIAAFNKFDNDMADAFFHIPMTWTTSMTWINKRIKSYDFDKLSAGEMYFYETELTADEPIKE